jgi:hypothetical protein
LDTLAPEVAMKKAARNKLRLPREIVRELQVPELEAAAGGASATCRCGSCSNPHSTCPV